MPFVVSGKCWSTASDALTAFQKNFPIIGDAGLISHVSSSINGSGKISYFVSHRTWTSNFAYTRSGTIQLSTCSNVDAPSAFDPTIAGSIFAVFFIGVVGMYLLSANIGLILEAIKKW